MFPQHLHKPGHRSLSNSGKPEEYDFLLLRSGHEESAIRPLCLGTGKSPLCCQTSTKANLSPNNSGGSNQATYAVTLQKPGQIRKVLWGSHKTGRQIRPFFEETHQIQSTKAVEKNTLCWSLSQAMMINKPTSASGLLVLSCFQSEWGLITCLFSHLLPKIHSQGFTNWPTQATFNLKYFLGISVLF